MNTNNLLLKLNTVFNDYKFYEKDHYYTYSGKRVKYSVTQFIDTKHIKFDKENLSKYVAQRDNLTQKEVLDLWDKASKIACDVGTLIHIRSEQLSNNKIIDLNFSNYNSSPFIEEIKCRLNKLIPLQDNFFIDIHNKLIPIKTEFTVGYEDIIAGNIDLLAWNIKDEEFQIWDYKTNKEIKTENKYQKLLDEFNFLDDCEFNKYSIQLGIYKELIQRRLNIKIGKCYLVWFNEHNTNYKLFKCLDLQESINQALDNLIGADNGRNNSN